MDLTEANTNEYQMVLLVLYWRLLLILMIKLRTILKTTSEGNTDDWRETT